MRKTWTGSGGLGNGKVVFFNACATGFFVYFVVVVASHGLVPTVSG
jgi:hypothetical protein